MKNVINLLFTSFILLAATSSYAVTVNGSLTVGGVLDNVPSNTVTLIDAGATGATGNIAGTVDGLSLGTGGVTADLVSFNPVSGFFVVEGWTLDLTSLAVINGTDFLNLAGAGVLHHAQFDDTNVNWTFSAQDATSYSMTVTAVPVPAAIWLFGSGLIGLVSVIRRKA